MIENTTRKMQVPAYCPVEAGTQDMEKRGVLVDVKNVMAIWSMPIIVVMPDIDELPVAVGIDIPAIVVVDIVMSIFIFTRLMLCSIFRSRCLISVTVKVRLCIVFAICVFDGGANGRNLRESTKEEQVRPYTVRRPCLWIYGAGHQDEQLSLDFCIPMLGTG
jgi:hypothetical protein